MEDSHPFHTSYLSFLLHWQDFRKPNFTPKKTTKGTKNTKNVSEKVKYMHFFHSIWKNLNLTENFYTDMSVVSVTNMRYEIEHEILRMSLNMDWTNFPDTESCIHVYFLILSKLD